MDQNPQRDYSASAALQAFKTGNYGDAQLAAFLEEYKHAILATMNAMLANSSIDPLVPRGGENLYLAAIEHNLAMQAMIDTIRGGANAYFADAARRCRWCGQIMESADGCQMAAAFCPTTGKDYVRELVTRRHAGADNRCLDCGGLVNHPHHPGCTREYCPECNKQLINSHGYQPART